MPLLAQKLIEKFKKRNIEGFYFETKEDELKKSSRDNTQRQYGFLR